MWCWMENASVESVDFTRVDIRFKLEWHDARFSFHLALKNNCIFMNIILCVIEGNKCEVFSQRQKKVQVINWLIIGIMY